MINTINNSSFTGERFIPECAELESEIYGCHMERYKFADNFVKDKIILDLSCGDGYGSFMLAQTASVVYGIDKDKETIDLAKIKYKKENLHFSVGMAEAINFSENFFDVVVSFETIEHLTEGEQKLFLSGVKKSLRKGGKFIISTPDKDIGGFGHNRFHLTDLNKQDFIELMSVYFHLEKLYGQDVMRKRSALISSIRTIIDFLKTGLFWQKIKKITPSVVKSNINKLTNKYTDVSPTKISSFSKYSPQELDPGFSAKYLIAVCQKEC